jgi:hypothetical protein
LCRAYEIGIRSPSISYLTGRIFRRMSHMISHASEAARLGLREADIGVASSDPPEVPVRDKDSPSRP